MTKVILRGALAKAVGRRVWNLFVDSPAEALRAIEANTGKLFRYLIQEKNGSVPYRVLVDGKDFSGYEELTLALKSYKTIEFIPVLGGSGGGIWQIIVGALLVVVAIVLVNPGLLPYSWALFGTATSTVAGFAALVGVSLILGGISQLLTPSQVGFDTGGPSETKPSYNFSGPVNTVRQGNPVPVGYGRLLVGSQVISSGVETYDLI